MTKHASHIMGATLFLTNLSSGACGQVIPAITSNWWQVAGNPDVAPYTTAGQQPVDFGIWQDAGGNWRIWSCIRGTSYPGNTRLFHGWESPDLFASNWSPTGIEMTSNTALGEVSGGLQAPYVFREGNTFNMFYGTWDHVARAVSTDGENFTRVIQSSGTTSLFGDGQTNPRDPTVLKISNTYYAYYTAHTNGEGKDYLRTSTNLDTWSVPTVVAYGGAASGTGSFSAECPFVYYDADTAAYYLFRTEAYGASATTNVYRSTDPTYFGVGADADSYFVGSLPIAAPEIFNYQGKTYVAALNSGLNGIQIAELDFVTPPVNPDPLFDRGGKWQVTERRMNTSASGGFLIDSVADATSLLNLPANDPRIAFNNSYTSSVINLTTADAGHFGNDSAFSGGAGNDMALRVSGQFYLNGSGDITFGITANDGAVLRVDGQQVLLDDTANAASDTFGTIQLAAGRHDLELIYFQRSASAMLELFMANDVGTFTQLLGANAPANYRTLLEAAPIPGDYDHDGDVDNSDYMTWRNTFGAMGSQAADGNHNGVVDAADYVVWRKNRTAAGSGALNSGSIPEPPTWVLFVGGSCLTTGRLVLRVSRGFEKSLEVVENEPGIGLAPIRKCCSICLTCKLERRYIGVISYDQLATRHGQLVG
jgi:PA14 domain